MLFEPEIRIGLCQNEHVYGEWWSTLALPCSTEGLIRDGDALWKIWINPLEETNLGMASFSGPEKDTILEGMNGSTIFNEWDQNS